MPVAHIPTYALPTSDQWPASRAPWRPEPSRAVLLVHDLQEYFLEPFADQAQPVVQMLENLQLLLAACRARGVPIVFSAQPGEQDRIERGLLWDLWGPGIISAPTLSRIHRDFVPQEGDLLLHKRRYSAFFETGLEEHLEKHKRSQLWIAGVYGHIGCLATATDGFMRGIQPFFVADAIADFSLRDHLMALHIVARTCGVVTETCELLESLEQDRLGSHTHTSGPSAQHD